EELERLWKVILLNQFHDIIPGSSVHEVYQDSAREYAELESTGEKMVHEAVSKIAEKLQTEGMENPVALFHQADTTTEARLPWDKEEGPASLRCGAENLPVQVVDDIYGKALVFPVPAAARGAVAVGDLSSKPAGSGSRLRAGTRRIENEEFIVRFDSHGNITSITTQDEEPLEFIQPGELANVLHVLDDKPLFWDAWDTDIYSQETAQAIVRSESFRVVEKGPVRAAVEVVKKFGASTVRQRISVGPTPGIRFDTYVDWHETNKMLKMAFPLNVHSDYASFDIQFGHVRRPTHRNTTWDLARFEVCAQKWADLSEGGHGAALINQGKYGYDVLGNVLRLSLLKSPKAPDPVCDMGEHRFTYVLYPHFDQVAAGRVVAASYAVNAKPWVVPIKADGGESIQLPPFVRVNSRNLVVESVKKAEDSDRVIVRLYECHQTRGKAHVELATGVKKAWLCNLEEVTQGDPLEVTANGVTVEYKPFEIITLMLEV
ncbi:MAG: glycoside hydrolase family 38 C-terminal domain-containing protein, partial [Armatimonadota bacterium]